MDPKSCNAPLGPRLNSGKHFHLTKQTQQVRNSGTVGVYLEFKKTTTYVSLNIPILEGYNALLRYAFIVYRMIYI